MVTWRSRLAVMMVAVVAIVGCTRSAQQRPVPSPEPPGAPEPAQDVPPPEPPPLVPPSEADLTLMAARQAEARGDHAGAVALYERAAVMPIEVSRLADIHYSLALLHADAGNPNRDLDKSMAELQAFAGTSLDHPRAREARVIGALLLELSQLKADATQVRAEIEGVKTDLTSLRTKLDEKEKELAAIKKVLLRNNTKP